MALYTTIHLHNVATGSEAKYATWFEVQHRESVARLRGIQSIERYEVASAQVMPDILQPWRFVSVYDFNLPEPAIDIPALGPLIATARDMGLVASDDAERLYTYRLYSDWKGSSNWHRSEPFSGISVLLGNYVAGHATAYHQWYDEVHGPEVIDVPGHVAIKRGELASIQIEPKRHCPGDQLIMVAQQTDDLAFTIADFSARAGGRSISGIAMQPRSKTGSFARTVHYFNKVSGKHFWPGGIAYDGNLAVYSGKG